MTATIHMITALLYMVQHNFTSASHGAAMTAEQG
jgi:hypothetical protein